MAGAKFNKNNNTLWAVIISGIVTITVAYINHGNTSDKMDKHLDQVLKELKEIKSHLPVSK